MQDNAVSVNRSRSQKNNLKWIIAGVLVLVVVLSVGSAIYYYNRYQGVKTNPTKSLEDNNVAETQRVLNKVGSVMLLAESDTPTVARVETPAKLQEANKEFYKDVQVGDYLIIYPKRAIIYRESNNQIINVAPIINTADLEKAKSQTEGTTQPAKTN